MLTDANNAYTACFSDNKGRDFFVACVQMLVSEGNKSKELYQNLVFCSNDIDVSLRYDANHVTFLLLSYNSESIKALLAKLSALDIAFVNNADDFDNRVFIDKNISISTDYHDFTYQGSLIGTNFRLFHYWLSHQNRKKLIYQITLHKPALKTAKELNRNAKKYAYYLQIESDLPSNVLVQQVSLLDRLNSEGWIANEIVFSDDESLLRDFKRNIDDTFTHTSLGERYQEAPLSMNKDTETLLLGYSPLRDKIKHNNKGDSSVILASYFFLQEELEFLSAKVNAIQSKPSVARFSEENDKKDKVFISYTANDFIIASKFRTLLETAGYQCWMAPDDINVTNLAYPSAILQGLDESSSLVVVFSDLTNFSTHVAKEVDLAISRKLLIMPLRIENVQPKNDLQYLLSLCQWIDKFDKTDEETLNEIITRLNY